LVGGGHLRDLGAGRPLELSPVHMLRFSG
jgi:hypothetical protein